MFPRWERERKGCLSTMANSTTVICISKLTLREVVLISEHVNCLCDASQICKPQQLPKWLTNDCHLKNV